MGFADVLIGLLRPSSRHKSNLKSDLICALKKKKKKKEKEKKKKKKEKAGINASLDNRKWYRRLSSDS